MYGGKKISLTRFLVAAMLVGAVWGTSGVARADYDRRTAVVEAIAKTRDAIVNLRTMRVVPARFDEADNGGRVKGLGTGVLIDPRGYLVTNYHVVEKVDQIEVMTSTRETFPARVVRHDERADLAILRIEAKRKFSYLPLAPCSEPLLGETVIAIGNPFGLENSVTTGILSAIDRELKLPNGEVFSDLLQTDASINPGNSGGPLLNINGELLGVNVAIRSNSQGIGFAIPTQKVREIVDKIMGAGEQSLVTNGLFLKEVELRGKRDQNLSPLVRVSRVEPDSPAYKLGFREGDELVEVAEQPVRVQFDINRILWDRKAGDSLLFRVKRGDKVAELTLAVQGTRDDAEYVWRGFGIRARKAPVEEVQAVSQNFRGGLRLIEVASGSPADRAGFRVGDILIGLHQWETVEINNVRYVMDWKDLAAHQPIAYHLIRGGKLESGNLQMAAAP